MAQTLKAKKSIYCSQVCHAWCCRNLVMKYEHESEKDIEQFFKLRSIEYEADTHAIVVPCRCKWISNRNKCKLYSWRPNSCREYECEKLKSMTLDS